MPTAKLKSSLPLAALFLVALPLFAWAQWEPRSWVADQMNRHGASGIVSYANVNKSFPGIEFEKVSVNTPAFGPLDFDSLVLQPTLATLAGKRALSARIEATGMQAGSLVVLQNHRIDLSDMMLHADAASLSRLDPRLLLLALSGMLDLQGELGVNADTGLPLDGGIELTWSNASSSLLPAGIESLHLSVHAGPESQAGQWLWKLESQPQGPTGEGRIVLNSPDLRQWVLRGNLKIAKDSPQRVLSGTLGSPRWQ